MDRKKNRYLRRSINGLNICRLFKCTEYVHKEYCELFMTDFILCAQNLKILLLCERGDWYLWKVFGVAFPFPCVDWRKAEWITIVIYAFPDTNTTFKFYTGTLS